MTAEMAFRAYLDAAGYREVRRGELVNRKLYVVNLVNGGGRTYQFSDHYVTFDPDGRHLSTCTHEYRIDADRS